LKGVPILNSILHLAGGLLHFLLGYSVFGILDGRSLEIGCFFAIVFTAGHLTHEVRDFDADLRNGIMTNAVKFGKARSLTAGFALFTLADALLIVLANKGTVPHYLIAVAALFPLRWYWSLTAMRAGLTFESVRRLQVRYRAIYAIIGVVMAITALS
jgi:1,4-dihydroxy-2-naphthoate octaprenyltransferase